MTSSVTFTIMISLILATTGCQTDKTSRTDTFTPDTDTNLSVAAAFLDGGQPQKAMFELRGILEKEPKNSKALTLMGLAQLALKNPKKAVEHLEKAWTLEAKSEHALNLSSAYLENNQLDSAQKIIKKGLNLKEKPPYRHKERFYHNLGLVAERKRRLDLAQKSYEEALVENPTFYLSRARLAQIYESKKMTKAAQEHWEMARAACPSCFEATSHLSQIYKGKGDIKTALGLVRDYRKIEGLTTHEMKSAAELELSLNAEFKRSAMSRIDTPKQESER
jgi:Tfp pilus assembly protein PilF